MSDQGIFWIGVFTTLLLGSGILITIWEFHKMNDQVDKNRDLPQKANLEVK